MKRYLLFAALAHLAVLVAVQEPLFAQSGSHVDSMSAANQLYESGRYAEAAQAYQQLADQGHRDSSLYYNLGNSHYKHGDLGRAIFNYLRAERLAPRDTDVQANLEVARGQTVDLFDSGEGAPLIGLVARAHTWFTLNETAIGTLGLWFILGSLLAGLLLDRRGTSRRVPISYAAAVLAVLLTAGVLSLGTRLYSESTNRTAVVVAEEVDVASGPGSQYITEFTLHSGAEARLLETRANWVRLALPGRQLQGWVPAGAAEEVGRAYPK